MTFDEWLAQVPNVAPNSLSFAPAIAIPDVPAIRPIRYQLWRLSDYLVSSVSAGTIWLVLRVRAEG